MRRCAQRVRKKLMITGGKMQYPSLGNNRAKKHRDDAHHGIRYPAKDEAIHDQPEIYGFEPPQECSRAATVTDLSQFNIGQDLSTPPVSREKKDREHAAEAHAPPDPVPGNTLGCHKSAYQKWSISRECGCHHGGAGQPPGNIASGEKKIFSVGAGAAHVIHADQQIDQQVSGNDKPINPGEQHVISPSCSRTIVESCSSTMAAGEKFDPPLGR